ncbi:hypothetical protein V5R04_09395 [Jonesiaceae bacterium BS-20]|uniref:Uncharacterized protein n=1 Tax=Jonesiaceae bacterium BS-20 TaxID=3120821 RepID=A0AAU7DT35_9MICO
MKTMTKAEFEQHFTVVPPNPERTTKSSDVDMKSTFLWTLVDIGGKLYLLSGQHKYNSLAGPHPAIGLDYLTTKEPWDRDLRIQWT